MGLFNWLRDSLTGPSPCNKRVPFEPDPPGPASFPPKPPLDVAAAINRQLDRAIATGPARRNGGYQPRSHGGTPNPPPSDFDDYLDREIARRRGSNLPPPIKPQPTGGRLIYGDRDPVPAEMPSNELMSRWREECRQLSTDSDYAIPASSFMAQRVAAWARQQQTQSFQVPPPGAEPVATDGDLLKVLDCILWADDARRAIYDRGRADERTAILRALGVKP